MVLVDELSLVEVIPVFFTVEGISDGALGLHVLNDVKSTVGVSVVSTLVDAVGLVKTVSVSADSDGSVLIDDNHVFVGSEVEGDNEGVDVNRVVVGSTAFFEAVSESDEGVDLELLVVLGPGGDDEEGTNDVSVDGEEEDSDGRVDAGFVEGDGVSQVVPVFFLEEVINLGRYFEQGHFGLSLGFGDGERVEVGVFC